MGHLCLDFYFGDRRTKEHRNTLIYSTNINNLHSQWIFLGCYLELRILTSHLNKKFNS